MLQAAFELSGGRSDMIAFSCQRQLKILFDLRPRFQAIKNPYKFYVFVTNNVEIVQQTHSGKNAAADENLNKSGKEL